VVLVQEDVTGRVIYTVNSYRIRDARYSYLSAFTGLTLVALRAGT
jgi:hypothetical protein